MSSTINVLRSRATVALLLSCGLTTASFAQVRPMRPDTTMKHPAGMHEGPAMAAMMASPHHALSMAYRDNLLTFAQILRTNVTRSRMVSPTLARPATLEIRRNFDQMKLQHDSYMTSMGTPMAADTSKGGMMRDMQAHVSAIEMHLGALETEVAKATPDATLVIDHTAQIIKQCDGMMPTKAGKVGMRPRKNMR